MVRLACVEIPALPLSILLDHHPDWRDSGAPVAVVAEDRPLSRILWVNPAARAAGILPGMRYAAALAVTSALRAGPVPEGVVAATVARIGCVIVKRASATIRKTASAEQNDSFVSDDVPWRKNGGGVRSRVPSAIVVPAPLQLTRR